MKIELTAIGSGYFRVYVNGTEVSKHIAEREANQSAINQLFVDPAAKVTIDHDYDVTAELFDMESQCPLATLTDKEAIMAIASRRCYVEQPTDLSPPPVDDPVDPVDPVGPTDPPAIPTGVSASSNGSSVITVLWDNVSDASSYDIYRHTSDSNGDANKIGDAGENATSFINTGLTPETVYYYWVVSKNAAGESGFSATATATTSESSAISLTNITTLQDAGWPVPDPETWWIDPPTPEAVKASLIPPHQNDADGICIKRLWIPRVLAAGNFNPPDMTAIMQKAWQSHCGAITAHYQYDVVENTAAGDLRMASTKQTWWSEANGAPFKSKISINTTALKPYTMLLGLDWIRWDDAEEFEAAFVKVRESVEAYILSRLRADRNFRATQGGIVDGVNTAPGEGFWNASSHLDAFPVESLLAICAYGVNPGGPSHAWAANIIDHWNDDPETSTEATYSPFELCNGMSLIDLGNGGGREWGSCDYGPEGIGGYEMQFNQASGVVLKCFDTATDSAWNLLGKCLYIQNRWRGIVVQHDRTVAKSYHQTHALGWILTMAQQLGDTEAGRRYKWAADNQDGPYSYWQEFRAISPPPPTAEGASGEFAGRVGSRWYYRADRSQPSSTFRFHVINMSLDMHRERGEERTMSFAVGDVGLVSGHANRCFPIGVVANGVWVGRASAAGDPKFADSNWWGQPGTIGLYHSSHRAVNVLPVATNPVYLVGAQTKPTLVNGNYKWVQDWSDWLSVFEEGKTRATGAVSSFDLNPSAKTLIIEDTMTVDRSNGLYIGWHFSPNFTPDFITDGFEFGDGINRIRVTVTPLGEFGLSRTVKDDNTPFNLDTYSLELEWHKTTNGKSLDRIAANVGFIPDTITADNIYKVRTTIEVIQ